jgi:TRAP-type C4-dicarboxylate transport system substrate-binding protein
MSEAIPTVKSDFGSRCRKKAAGSSFLKIFIAIFLMASAAPASVQAETQTLGHTVPPNHVWHKVAMRFADNLAAASQDKFSLKVVPFQKLGNEPQLFSMVQSGAIAFTILPAAFLSNREESLLGWFLPYIFEDVKQAGEAAALPAADRMLKNLETHGVVGVGYMFAGMRHVLSVKPVNSPDDLANKKIRAFPSPIFNDWWQANGAAPTALPLAEIAPSLTTNLLDAVDVDLDIIMSLQYHHQASFLTLTNHMAFPAIIIASKKWWEGLSPEDRDLFEKAYKEAEQYGLQLQIEAETNNLRTLKADGAVVNDINLDSFKEKAEQVREKYISRNDLIRQFTREVEGVK